MKFCQLKLKRKMLGRFQDTANCGETSKIYGQEWIHQWEIFFFFWMWGPYIHSKD